MVDGGVVDAGAEAWGAAGAVSGFVAAARTAQVTVRMRAARTAVDRQRRRAVLNAVSNMVRRSPREEVVPERRSTKGKAAGTEQR